MLCDYIIPTLELRTQLQRRMDRENDDTLRHELDQEFNALRSLLMDPGPSSSRDHIATTSPAGFAGVDLLRSAETQNKDYDQNVRELAFEKRAKAKDRTKTEEEIALEEKTALEKAEQRRKRRMQGEDFDSDEEEEEQGGKRKRMPVADDLGDAFDDEEEAEWGGLGPGLTEVSQEADEGIDPEESGSEKDSEDSLSFDPADEIATGHGGDLHQDGKSTTHLGRRRSHGVVQELPYTFPCPTTHVEFLDVVKDVDDKDVPTVLQRIRALYHPSLGPDNKLKLHVSLFISLRRGITSVAIHPGLDVRATRPHSLHHCTSGPPSLPSFLPDTSPGRPH
jgi:nucleolar protein 14